MHPDIFTPGTCHIIVPLCLTTDAPLAVKHIFEDNRNCAAFRLAEKDNRHAVEPNEVNKMLSCKNESRGFFTYECVHCGITKSVYFRCNGRIYTNCGKNFNPHIHILVTEGGFDRHGRFIHQKIS